MAMNDDKKAAGAGTIGGAAVGGVAGGAAAGAAAGGMTGPVGAAVGAAVGAGVGALSGKAAADTKDSGGMRSGRSTVIGAFDDESQAQRAVDRLVADGFDRSDVHVERGESASTQEASGDDHKKGGFFSWLFGEEDTHEPQRNTYTEAVRRGSSVVVVDVQDDEQAEHAVSCLHELGAIDVDERARQWRSEGWTDRHPVTAMDDRTGKVGEEGVLDVVQEELQVGKRQLDRGGVRVIQRVSEKPIREVLRLREESAVVDRRPVDRPATSADLSTFKEGTLEVRETVEKPVVSKTARVVEEVRVGKKVREREETIEDTVRRKDVEVQRMDRATNDPQQRAAASDKLREDVRTNRDLLGNERGSDRGTEREIGSDREPTDLTGKPRKNI